MRYARNFNGVLVDAEKNKSHENFICPLCNNLAHWRKMSIDYKRPHFYHAEANEDCPLSTFVGKWTVVEDNEVIFDSELESETYRFQKETKPDLSKIPRTVIRDNEYNEHITQGIITIRINSEDVTLLDSTILTLADFIKTQRGIQFLVIPLPVKTVSNRGEGAPDQRIYHRLIKILGVSSKLLEKLSTISIPENIELLIKSS